MICAFLDENGSLFSHRILSRDECLNATSKKDNLSSLFPDDCGDAMVCIIDDREDVWNHATNLIQVKPYHFFQHTGDINAPPGLAKRELDGKGVDFNKIKLQKSKGKKKIEEKNENSNEKSEKIEEKTEKKEEVNESSEKKDEESVDKAEKPEKSEEKPVNSEEKSETTETEEVTEGSKTPPPVSTSDDAKEDSEKKEEADDNLVEIQDPDDYLLYLESILKLIHERFYETYDKTKEIPDLKLLVPKLKSQVLVGVKIVFSGLVPNIVKLQRSRPYLIAKNLGAEVTEGINETTTHLVAASTGTQKVFQAQKNKKIQVVTPDWLWTCAERWEHVNEKLFPLSTSKTHKMRQIPAHCSPDRIPEPDEVKFNNPYFQMEASDIAEMEAEVEDTTSESEGENSPPEAERTAKKRKRSTAEKEAPEKKPATVDISGKGDEESISSESGKSGRSSSDEDEEESPSAKFRRGEKCTIGKKS
jgi:RNA polymerase II subunit A C-terminal domain phosphatase